MTLIQVQTTDKINIRKWVHFRVYTRNDDILLTYTNLGHQGLRLFLRSSELRLSNKAVVFALTFISAFLASHLLHNTDWQTDCQAFIVSLYKILANCLADTAVPPGARGQSRWPLYMDLLHPQLCKQAKIVRDNDEKSRLKL